MSIDGIRAQALAHAARTLAGWLLPAADSAAERDSLGAALALVLMFGWGIAGRVGASARHLGMDHDGTVRLWGGAEEDRAAVERALSGVRET